MNIYEKLAAARVRLADTGLKKGAKNEYTKNNYFELADFLPTITKLAAELGFICIPSFGADFATMRIVDTDKPDDEIIITSPMSTAELKGVHAVQNLGAVQTYLRRYLYMAAFEVVETDALDGASETTKTQATKAQTTTAQAKTAVSTTSAPADIITKEQKTALVLLCVNDEQVAALTDIRKRHGYAATSQIKVADLAVITAELKAAIEDLEAPVHE